VHTVIASGMCRVVRVSDRCAGGGEADAAGRLRPGLVADHRYEGRDIADPAVLRDLDATAAACASATVARWREAWLGLGRTVVAMLVLDDGYVS